MQRNKLQFSNSYQSYKSSVFPVKLPLDECHGISSLVHDDVIKWKNFPRNWPFVRGIYRSPVNSPHKGQWRGALMCSVICVWINDWVNNRETGDLRRYHAHYDVIVMSTMVQVMGLCLQVTVYHLIQCWENSMTSHCVARPQWVIYNNEWVGVNKNFCQDILCILSQFEKNGLWLLQSNSKHFGLSYEFVDNITYLKHDGLVTPYGDIYLGQHWLR